MPYYVLDVNAARFAGSARSTSSASSTGSTCSACSTGSASFAGSTATCLVLLLSSSIALLDLLFYCVY